ncbi:MAG: hypothetical protein HC914_13390 [Chloroflexaceae bacterium]|nr:hypothetical protein [Chloroflexaceae bacterium]
MYCLAILLVTLPLLVGCAAADFTLVMPNSTRPRNWPAHLNVSLPHDWIDQTETRCTAYIMEHFTGRYTGPDGDYNEQVFAQASRIVEPRIIDGYGVIWGNMAYPEGSVRTRGPFECWVNFSTGEPQVWLKHFPSKYRMS